MSNMKLALCAAVASVAFGGSAMAQVAVTGNVAIVSDYVFRGYSQTDEKPAIQGGVDATSGPFYAGLWASNVDFGNGTDAEVDAYVGVKPVAAGITFDLAAIYYGYVDGPSNQGYWEFKAAASRAFGPATLGAAVYYSPEFFGETDEATYGEINAAYAFNDKWSASGAVGYQDVSYDGDYTTWNAGVTWAFAPKLTLDARYTDTDVEDTDIAEGRGVVTLKAVFP